jgi:hypothetical protein
MRVTVNLLIQVWFVIISGATVTVEVPPQLSVVVTDATLGAGTWLAHCTVTFIGQVRAGPILSNTVIIWAQVAELPHASVAV